MIEYYKNSNILTKTIYFSSNLDSIIKSYRRMINCINNFLQQKMSIGLIGVKFNINPILQKIVYINLTDIISLKSYLKIINFCLKVANIKHIIKLDWFELTSQYIHRGNNFYHFYFIDDLYFNTIETLTVGNEKINVDKVEIWTKRFNKEIIVYIPFRDYPTYIIND